MALDPNTRYPGKTDVPSASYPYGSARNVTAPGDGLGTPWEEDIANDIFGFQQELLDKAGITPSNTPDAVDASQYYEAMRLTAGYPGLVVPYMLTTDPATLGLRILLLDGSGVLVANYADLSYNCWVGAGANAAVAAAGAPWYRADNANGSSPNAAGAYLVLPDCRGQFLRGQDTPGAIDPDGASRYVGDIQDYAIREHFHYLEDSGGDYDLTTSHDWTGASAYSVLGPTGGTPTFATGGPIGGALGAVVAANTDAAESRPTNVMCKFGVWY